MDTFIYIRDMFFLRNKTLASDLMFYNDRATLQTVDSS